MLVRQALMMVLSGQAVSICISYQDPYLEESMSRHEALCWLLSRRCSALRVSCLHLAAAQRKPSLINVVMCCAADALPVPPVHSLPAPDQRQSWCAADAVSAKKYYHFIRVMGRAASHIALECALQTRPQTAFISEEVAAKKLGLVDITNQVDTGIARAQPAVLGHKGVQRMPVTQQPLQRAWQTAPRAIICRMRGPIN